MSADGFPTDIKNCMKDCILSILWSRQAILSFLRDNGCAPAELNPIQKFKDEQIPRGRMVEMVFDKLAARADGGLGQFRAMLKSLTDWSHFDAYYFDKLGKLDRGTAQRHLDHLKQLVELRDAKVREERQRRKTAAQKQQAAGERVQA